MDNDLYLIHCSSQEIFLQYKKNTSQLLSINLKNGNIKEETQSILKDKVLYSTIKAKAILGIIKILSLDLILYVKTAQSVGFIDNYEIFRIIDVDFVQVLDPSFTQLNPLIKEITDYINGIKNLLKLGFYYSFGYDLTTSRQNQSKKRQLINTNNYDIESNNNPMKNMYETVTNTYFFNYKLYEKFLNRQNNNLPYNYNFITPIICGYVSIFEEEIEKNKKVKFVLISRRSKHHAGTRYNTRGIDDEGHVANYVETEQIIYYQNNILSFTQIRGSVPIFFQQVGLTAQTEITRNRNLTIEAFTKHIKKIQKDYPLVFCVNLLNMKKPGENVIIKEFENQIKMRAKNKRIKYYYFDMQNECKNDNYDNIDNLMKNMVPIEEIFQFFCEDGKTGEVHKEQRGIFRTNCLDCLDRTNVIQTRLAWLALGKMLNYLNLNCDNLFNNGEKFFGPSKNNFKRKFIDSWADNGDEISIQYAGTASTITTVTKNGGHNFYGMIQHGIATVTRIYQGSFEDGFKQKCFDIFLQKSSDDELVNPLISNELRIKEKEFTKYNNFIIYIGSWNIGGKNLNNALDITNWLIAFKNQLNNVNDDNYGQKELRPDIYFLGFEEIIDLNATNIMISSNKDKKESIKSIISEAFTSIPSTNEEYDPYILIKELDLVGLYFLSYVKQSVMKNIKNLDTQFIKSGLMGNIGNKGSILMRFNINDTNLAISCNHLTAGTQYYETRRNQIIDILNTSFSKYPNKNFKDYDYYFLFGDLNFRLDLELNNQLIDDLIKNQFKPSYDVSKLLMYDQFYFAQKENSLISQMNEAQIKFLPTYKYCVNENKYNIEKRVPAYCDRILFKKKSETIPIVYNRCEYNLSDHKPIYGVYKIKTKIINQESKQKILNEIIQNYENNLKENNSGFKKNAVNLNYEENFFMNKRNSNENNNNININKPFN